MARNHSPRIVTDGLVLCLDAANRKSYPGSGNTWFDVSGGNRHYTFGSGITWNSSGHFTCNGTGIFTGPASNTFGFTSSNQHTIEVVAHVTSITNSNFFWWYATPSVGSDTRAIATHFPYGGGLIYYDVSGCCGSTQRINYTSANLTAGPGHFVWRTRTNTTPNRQFFKNLTSEMDSGGNSTATTTWNLSTNATIGETWVGNLYSFKVYNRALSDNEIKNNFNALRGRFGI